jgi:hypothetical protein
MNFVYIYRLDYELLDALMYGILSVFYYRTEAEVGEILEVLVLEYDFGRTRTRGKILEILHEVCFIKKIAMTFYCSRLH